MATLDFDTLGACNGLKLVNMNVQSLMDKMNKLRKIDFKMDYISITESWLDARDQDWQVDLHGMTLYRNDRLGARRKSGGVACYVNNRYAPFTSIIDEFTLSTPDLETLCLITKFPGHKYRVILTVYRPPKANVTACYNTLKSIVKSKSIKKREIWIQGDFNVCTLKRNSPKCKHMFEFLRKTKMKYLQTKATYFHPHGRSSLDHVYTNCKHVSHNGVINDKFGDHVPVYVVKKQKKLVKEALHKEITGRSYKSYEKDKTSEFVDGITWHIDECRDADECLSMLTRGITDYLDKEHPVRTLRFDITKPEGFTREVVALLKEKKKHLKKSRRVPQGELNVYVEMMSAIDKKVKSTLIDNRRVDIKNKLEMYKYDSRRFWSEVTVLWKGPRKEIVMKLRNDAGVPVADANTANFVNDFYVSIGEKLADAFPPIVVEVVTENANMGRPLLRFVNLTSGWASAVIADMKITKSSCLDNIKTNVVKDFLSLKPEFLVKVVNSSIDKMEFPASCKNAKVIPLPKSGDLFNVSNWRPVSQLNCYSKLIESVIHKQLMCYLLSHNIISENQFGFMPQRSTADAIYGLCQYAYECRNRGEIVAIVFLDLKKAFDTVNHFLLLKELSSIGASNNVISWFRSYLSGRRQITSANGQISTDKPVNCGVPQGSVLGPLLFVIYINTIVNVILNARYFMYADDLAIIVGNKDPIITQQLIQEDLNRISDWCDSYRLTVNASKTKVLWCHGERDYVDYSQYHYELKGSVLDVVSEFNYLGVLIDEVMCFRPQCEKIINSGNLRLYQLRKLRKYIDVNLSLLLFKQMILPVLDYGDIMTDSGPETPVSQIQIIQNHCLRACIGVKDPQLVHRVQLHELCHCETLAVRRERNLLGRIYKLSRNHDNTVVPVRELRGNTKIKIKVQRPKGKFYTDSPLYRGYQAWSKLDAEVQHMDTFTEFITEICKK